MIWLLFVIFSAVSIAKAEVPLRLCIYGDNRGSNRVHREILRQAQAKRVRLFVIAGDVVKHDYGARGTPEAVLDDYRAVLGTARVPLTEWPAAPGPAVFTAVGGHDEQFFLDSHLAAVADTTKAGRYAYEGTSELGLRLYEAFSLSQMRLRVQALDDIGRPLPLSRYGDYLLVIGSGARRECALLVLYRSDRWCFREDQVNWVDSVLTGLRRMQVDLPLVVVAHDWTWLFPDTLDDGRTDGFLNAIREGAPEYDREQKRRLFRILERHRADVAVAADRHAYWADAGGPLLRINCAAAICKDRYGDTVAVDNLWLEFVATADSLAMLVHPIEPPIGCGLQTDVSTFGTVFTKKRTAGASWRVVKP